MANLIGFAMRLRLKDDLSVVLKNSLNQSFYVRLGHPTALQWLLIAAIPINKTTNIFVSRGCAQTTNLWIHRKGASSFCLEKYLRF